MRWSMGTWDGELVCTYLEHPCEPVPPCTHIEQQAGSQATLMWLVVRRTAFILLRVQQGAAKRTACAMEA